MLDIYWFWCIFNLFINCVCVLVFLCFVEIKYWDKEKNGNDKKLLYIHNYFFCFFCNLSNCLGVMVGYFCVFFGIWCIVGIGISGFKKCGLCLKI